MELGILTGSLPIRFILEDINKDPRGLGTFARTMEVCEEWATNYYGNKLSDKYLKDFTLVGELLDYVYELFSRPPLPTENPQHKVKVLSGIILILKTRGTMAGLKNYFNTLSVTVESFNITLPKKAIFDNNTEFDSEYDFDSYGDSTRYYDIALVGDATEFPDWQDGQITQDGISRMLGILEYLLPIGFTPKSVSFNGILIYNT